MARFLLLLFLVAGNAWLWTTVLLYSQNTLLRNGRWLSSKQALAVGTMGTDSFLLTRAALQGDRLHLEPWYGCNEVLWRRPFKPGRISFAFRLAPGAELSVVFNKTAQGFSGIRLSADPRRRPSLFFQAGPDGGFSSTQPLALPGVSGRWHRLELGFAAKELRLSLDGREAGTVAAVAPAQGQRFGFRGGFGPAAVDDVRIEDAAGRVETEDFSNRRGAWRALAVHAAALVLACGLAAALAGWRGRPWSWTAPRLAAVELILAGLGALLFLFDYCYWSGLALDSLSRPLAGPRSAPFEQRVEGFRYDLFAGWHARVAGQRQDPRAVLSRDYPGQRIWGGPVFCRREPSRPPVLLDAARLEELLARRKTAYRIVFVGASQMMGAGARNLSETFFARVHRALVVDFGPAFPIESLNLAVSGTDARTSFQKQRSTYLRFRPDLMVINFSSNGEAEDLRAGLAGYLRTNRERRIATLLLREALARNADFSGPGWPRLRRRKPSLSVPEGLGLRRQVVDAVAREFRIPILELDGHLNDPRTAETGLLWSDFIHLSSHGQAVAALWLAPRIADAIRRRVL